MKLRDILGVLDTPCLISIEKTTIDCKIPEDRFICMTKADSEGVLPYLDRDVVVWGLTNPITDDTPAVLYFRLMQDDKKNDEIWYKRLGAEPACKEDD